MYDVYTDGSCLGNPGRGGWGVVSDDFKLTDKQPNTTNNQMEMTAILKALEECSKINWKKNGWKTAAGTPVKNKELWIAIDEARNKLKYVEWKWVKAHNGDPKNEEVDNLARESANKLSA